MKRKTLSRFMFSLIMVLLVTRFSIPSSAVTAKITPPAETITIDNAVIDAFATNGSAAYWVDFLSHPDLSKAYEMSWEERGWYVYETLKTDAEKSQAVVRDYLSSHGVVFESFWIKNTILVRQSDPSVFDMMQQLPNVQAIRSLHSYALDVPENVYEPQYFILAGIEPNIAHVKADQVWGMGIDGAGSVVANIDTGVLFTHDALLFQYRGNNRDGTYTHDYNWFDPYGVYTIPTDANGHGTHTMGTMVGDDGVANQIGMAPGAQWIACRGCSSSSCTDAALLACAQFVTAPTTVTGTAPNPNMRPYVVNNSWGDCSTSYDNWYQVVVDAWQASGIYPVFSNGNASNCGYSAPPGLNTVGNPARYGNVTSVGSSGQQNGQYATHSNWGPTDNPDTINPTNGFDMLKPQVIAPGVSIRSSINSSNTSYTISSGTSMSAPHVTGLVALMWQAAPCLVGNFAVTENIMESTATDISYDDGSPLTPTNFPNFTTGWGEIDALAAVTTAAMVCGNGTLTGTITDSDTAGPLESVRVELTGQIPFNHRTVLTNASGVYTVGLLTSDSYTITASLAGYAARTLTNVVVQNGVTVTQDFHLQALPPATVTGVVRKFAICDIDPQPAINATVNLLENGLLVSSIQTVENGTYVISIREGAYDIQVLEDGYAPALFTGVLLKPGQQLTVDASLRMLQPCLHIAPSQLEQYLVPGTAGTQMLTISNTGAGGGLFVIEENPSSALQQYSPPAHTLRPEMPLPQVDDSKSAPARISLSAPRNTLQDIILHEGFELSFPPASWTSVAKNATTWAQDSSSANTGMYRADVMFDPELNAQDEWLLTGQLNFIGGILSVWSGGSVYWCRDNFDYCDLNVWIVVGEIGGTDDILVHKLEQDWSVSWTWDLSRMDLTGLAPNEPYRIGFQYLGQNGAEVYIDDVALSTGTSMDITWLSETPAFGTVLADDSTQIAINFETATLPLGDYQANLEVSNLPFPKTVLPVTVHVVKELPPRLYFFPIVWR